MTNADLGRCWDALPSGIMIFPFEPGQQEKMVYRLRYPISFYRGVLRDSSDE
jgi:hypothetical protein